MQDCRGHRQRARPKAAIPRNPIRKRLWPPAAVALALLAPARVGTRRDDKNKPIPGIGLVGKIVKLHAGFKFTEGPAADRHGNVYFSDVQAATTYKVDKDGKLTKFRQNTNNG